MSISESSLWSPRAEDPNSFISCTLYFFLVLLQFSWRRGFEDSRGWGYALRASTPQARVQVAVSKPFYQYLKHPFPLTVMPDRIDLVLRIFQLFCKCINKNHKISDKILSASFI